MSILTYVITSGFIIRLLLHVDFYNRESEREILFVG